MSEDSQVMVEVNRASLNKQISNFNKHLRIAEACSDMHERLVHLKKAEKLAIRYKFPMREATEKEVEHGASFGGNL